MAVTIRAFFGPPRIREMVDKRPGTASRIGIVGAFR
jgi:hypothetical protein